MLFVHVPQTSARLRYVLQWLLGDRLGVSYTIVTEAPGSGTVVAYGFLQGDISLPDAGLLFENGTNSRQIIAGTWDSLPVLFFQPDTKATLPFDLFSAIFYLLSRYEEYLPCTPDKYGRFPATESILFSHGLLERPVIDEWVYAFGRILEMKGISVRYGTFRFRPSYDIDMAWLYRNKGAVRTLGGYLKDLAAGQFMLMRLRTQVLTGQIRDPYDSFSFIDELSAAYPATFFVLAAKENAQYDKHIIPANNDMRQLIRTLSQHHSIGIHPSFRSSEKAEMLREEKQVMETITGKRITRSRQHYIRFRLPDTYRHLIENDIAEDYSMGYGTHLGFRAGTGSSFNWYDLRQEQQTALRIFPFCFMDTTAHFELKLDADRAFARLRLMQQHLSKSGSMLITIFHNSSLGSASVWREWKENYRQFITEL